MFVLKEVEIKNNILNSFLIKGSYGGRVAQEGEIREWGGKQYQKEGKEWKLVSGKSKSGDWTYGKSKFLPENTPEKVKKALPDQFFDKLETIPNIIFKKKKNESSYYLTEEDEVHVNINSSSYSAKEVYIHELGHKFHYDKDIITNEKVEDKFKGVYDAFKEEFDALPEGTKAFFLKENIGKGKEVLKAKFSNIKGIGNKYSTVSDVVFSITNGEFGYGHTKKYIKEDNNRYMELFAHGHEHYWLGNVLLEQFFPKSCRKMINYFKEIFE